MTETDESKRPIQMPEGYIPYLEKHKLYKIFKDMIKDLVIKLPKDPLKHMKMYIVRHLTHHKERDRIMLLAEPGLEIDMQEVAKKLSNDLGLFVITRRCVMDKYLKHDKYIPGCTSPELMSEVVKGITITDAVVEAGWLMFDHPCTVREARCLQQDGVLPNITIVVMAAPHVAPPALTNFSPARNFFVQDFEGLKFAYKATLKEIHVFDDDDVVSVVNKCINAVTAMVAGAQGPGQGFQVVGAPGTYRVLLIGPRGSGRKSQAISLAKHFGLVYLHLDEILAEAAVRQDEVGEKVRKFGITMQTRQSLVKERILKRDCIDNGWVMVGYPTNGRDFDHLDSTSTPPNRIIILNVDESVCKERLTTIGVDWCTGQPTIFTEGSGVVRHPDMDEAKLEKEWEYYYSETLADLRCAAGITAVEVQGDRPFEEVQVKIQAAVIAAPIFTYEAEQCNCD